MNLRTASTVATAIVLASACQTTVQLPKNVSTTVKATGLGDATFIDRADYSYDASRTPSFSELKLCIAENVQNQAVQLRDASGSFVGAATGTYYSASNVQTQSGGEVFKYSDEKLATLIASGTVMAAPSSLGLIQDIVRFDLRALVQGARVGLVFQNISRAQQNTGSSVNTGFAPVGASFGARAPEVVAALEGLAIKIKSCLK